jgi:hypothetical protein
MAQGVGLDLLTRVRNIKWAGATVAVGVEVAAEEGTLGRIYRGASGKTWTTVFQTGVRAFRSSSYAKVDDKSVFLMGGAGTASVDMMYSNNAANWSVVLSEPYFNVGAYGVMGIVWDPQAGAFFAASGATVDNEAIFAQRQLWRSTDGLSWSKETELTANSAAQIDGIDNEITEMFQVHCTKPANSGGIPDGFRAYNSQTGTLMEPAGLESWSINGPGFADTDASKIRIRRGNTSSLVTLPCDVVWGVSYFGGIWSALGVRNVFVGGLDKPSIVFRSSNNGATWATVFEHAGYFPAGIVSGR